MQEFSCFFVFFISEGNIWCGFFLELPNNIVDTRRRFHVDTTSHNIIRHCMSTGSDNEIFHCSLSYIILTKLWKLVARPRSVFSIQWKVYYKAFFAKVLSGYPAGIYLLKVDNKTSRAKCEICSKLIIMTPERQQWRSSGVFIVNFEHISHLVLAVLLLTLNM